MSSFKGLKLCFESGGRKLYLSFGHSLTPVLLIFIFSRTAIAFFWFFVLSSRFPLRPNDVRTSSSLLFCSFVHTNSFNDVRA